jgi:hypothetical protein
VKYYALAVLTASLVCGQTVNRTYTYDVNGRPVEDIAQVTIDGGPGSKVSRQLIRDTGGRNVPLEDVEEVLVSDSGGVRVVEKTIRRYSPDGRPGPPEKIRIEQRLDASGAGTVTTTTFRGDVNGRMQPAERAVSQVQKSGNETTTATSVERPTVNGSFELVERREESQREGADGFVSQNSAVFRRDANGRFEEVAKSTSQTVVENGVRVENAATYELGQLVRQTVSRTAKVNGGEQSTVDVYEAEQAGRVRSGSEAKPVLSERRVVETEVTGSGTVETVNVQRPLPSDPNRLSAPEAAERTICTGKCTAPGK